MVLLILAGVTLNLVIGNNGIISKAKDAKNATSQGLTNDQIAMNSLYDELVGLETGTGGGGSGDTIGKVAVGEEASKNSTINGEAPSEYNPIIPEGYIPINAGTANWGDGTTALNKDIVDKGLVITDSVDASGASNGNEWVWVPVTEENLSSLYVTATPAISITGGPGKTVVSGVSTSKYTASEIISGKTRVLPNDTSSHREPDVVVGSDGASYDAKDTYRAAAGFTKTVDGTTTTMTVSEMAQAMVKDYDDMTKSLEKYKGFYIGRYELSSAGVKKDQPTLTNTNWYNLYAKCKDTTLSASNKVTTRMIWGLQWDAACNWIASIKDEGGNTKYSITDSSKWGNYTNYNTANGYASGAEGYVTGAGSKQNTGYSEYWKANNIYDLAGNCWEWTQEAYGTGIRASRGGVYGNGGGVNPASDRGNVSPGYSDSSVNSSRPTLIVQP